MLENFSKVSSINLIKRILIFLINHNFVINKPWVSQEIQDIKEDWQAAECQSIKKRELSKKPDPYPTLSSSMTSQESEESESEEVTTSLELSDSRKVTSTGLLKQSPERPELSTSSITHPTTNSLELKLSLKTVLFKLTQLHSPNGTWTITALTYLPRRVRKPRLSKRRNPKEVKIELPKDKKTESLTLK